MTIYQESEKFGWKLRYSINFIEDPKSEHLGLYGLYCDYTDSSLIIKKTNYFSSYDEAGKQLVNMADMIYSEIRERNKKRKYQN